MHLWIREHLTPPIHTTLAFDLDKLDGMLIRPNGRMDVFAETPGDAWLLSNHTITTTGQVFTGPADPQYCGEGAAPQACRDWLGTLGLRQDLIYQPDSNFWPLQWAEAGSFLAVAALLAGFCFWWLRRRVS